VAGVTSGVTRESPSWSRSTRPRRGSAFPRSLAALSSQSFPDVTYLFVIQPGETALYDHLERAFLGVRGVKIIMER
jgi:hypothetical protein